MFFVSRQKKFKEVDFKVTMILITSLKNENNYGK